MNGAGISPQPRRRGSTRAHGGKLQVTLSGIDAVHVDGAQAELDVGAAAAAILEAELGSDDAQFVVDGAEGHELVWYAAQELGPLLELWPE